MNKAIQSTAAMATGTDADLSGRVIGLAIDVHRALGPGLLEGVYEACLCFELSEAGMPFQRQVALPVSYKGVQINAGYRADIIVEDHLILELKSVDRLTTLHDAQMLTYLRISGLRLGLILNFNTKVLKDGIRRLVL